MVYDTSQPPPSTLTSLSYHSLFVSQVEGFVVVACLTVSLCLTWSQVHGVILISNIAVLQLCVWDWLIMFADEVAMIGEGERRSRRYILDALYIVVR
jgi:hypothetical protein